MKVFKFGGASVKDASAVRNVAEIVKRYSGTDLVIVVSAMGKTTNALEQVANAWFRGEGDAAAELEKVRTYHANILNDLFESTAHPVYAEVSNAFIEIEWVIEDAPARTYDFEYDQIVSIGEMLSTKIVSAYLNDAGVLNSWLDVRDCIKTDNTYRDAVVDWEQTGLTVNRFLKPKFTGKGDIVVTQGFIGCTSENFTTTLGREGSDYTGAILAYMLDAEELSIWKDVPGMLNADPKFFDDTQLLSNVSYREAIELAYYGASVIHPKTIKPLENKEIPLYVRSFIHPDEPGTVINRNSSSDSLVPSFIFKLNQVLISISAKDFSFIVEEHLSDIFAHFAKHRITVNLMQNSAINFSVTVNHDPARVDALMEALHKDYVVKYNDNLELLTVRHYDQATIDKLTQGKEVLVRQVSRHTARLVMR